MSARTFAAKLDSNIDKLASDIRRGSFRFSALRPFLVEKPGSEKKRVICVPTVKDRLVQKRLSEYIHKRRLFPKIYNGVSFGFVEGLGPKSAIAKTIELRERFRFCFETDIISFFDSVPRNDLERKVKKYLKSHSICDIVVDAIRAEVRPSFECSAQALLQCGIKKGQGIRQGMPLSPMLSNLALTDFDVTMQRRGIPIVRYADDIVAFAASMAEALEIGDIIRDELGKGGYGIPKLGSNTKTNVSGRNDPVSFLGREIVYLDKEGRFIQRVSPKKLEKVTQSIVDGYSIKTLSETKCLSRNLIHLYVGRLRHILIATEMHIILRT